MSLNLCRTASMPPARGRPRGSIARDDNVAAVSVAASKSRAGAAASRRVSPRAGAAASRRVSPSSRASPTISEKTCFPEEAGGWREGQEQALPLRMHRHAQSARPRRRSRRALRRRRLTASRISARSQAIDRSPCRQALPPGQARRQALPPRRGLGPRQPCYARRSAQTSGQELTV